MQQEEWVLGDIQPYEEIQLIYSFVFNADSARGTYVLHSEAKNEAGTLSLSNNGFVRFAPVAYAQSVEVSTEVNTVMDVNKPQVGLFKANVNPV